MIALWSLWFVYGLKKDIIIFKFPLWFPLWLIMIFVWFFVICYDLLIFETQTRKNIKQTKKKVEIKTIKISFFQTRRIYDFEKHENMKIWWQNTFFRQETRNKQNIHFSK